MSMSKEELIALAQKFDSRKGRRPREPAPPTPALASKSDIEAAARLYDERLARASAYARARRRSGKGQSTMWELSQAQQQTPQHVSMGMNAEHIHAAINAAEQASVHAQQDAMNAQQEVQSVINVQHPAMHAEQIHEHDVHVEQEANAEGVPQEAADDVAEALHQHVPETEPEQSTAAEVAEEAAHDNAQEDTHRTTAGTVPESTTDDVPETASQIQETVSHEAEIAVPVDISESLQPVRQLVTSAKVAEKVEQVLTSTLNYSPRIVAKYFDTTSGKPTSFKRSNAAPSDQSPKKAKTAD